MASLQKTIARAIRRRKYDYTNWSFFRQYVKSSQKKNRKR